MRACYHRDAVFKVPRHLMIRVSQSVSLSFQHRSCSSTSQPAPPPRQQCLCRLAPILEAWLPSCAHIVSFLILFSSYQHAGAELPFSDRWCKIISFSTLSVSKKQHQILKVGAICPRINGTNYTFSPIYDTAPDKAKCAQTDYS